MNESARRGNQILHKDKNIKQMWRGQKIIVAFIAFSMLLFGHNVLAAREDDPQKAQENAEQEAPVMDAQKSPDDISEGREGYHPEGRRVGTPVDVERDLDFSFPKRD